MKVNDLYSSVYLKAGDIPETGMIVTIAETRMETLGQGKDAEEKPVLYFEEQQKGMVMNKTNSKAIVKVLGFDDTDDWVGHKIRLVATEVPFKDDMVEAIRVSARPVGQQPQQQPSRPSGPARRAAPATAQPRRTGRQTPDYDNAPSQDDDGSMGDDSIPF